MTFKDKIMLYLFNRSDIADSEYNDMLQMIRFHHVILPERLSEQHFFRIVTVSPALYNYTIIKG